MAREFHPASLNKRLIPWRCYHPSLSAGIHSVKGKRTISGSLPSKRPLKAPFPAAASLPIPSMLDAQPSTPSAPDAHSPFSDGGETGNGVAHPRVRISGPRGAGRLSCFPVLLSLPPTCVSIPQKFPAVAIKQPELGRALLQARTEEMNHIPHDVLPFPLSSQRPWCLWPCQSAHPAPLPLPRSSP